MKPLLNGVASYFMEIKSLLTLPKDKRSKASAKELLKALEEAEEQLGVFVNSPNVIAYNAIYRQVVKLCRQLEEGEIDIFNVEDKIKFEMAHKFMTELTQYLVALDEIRKRMTPDEVKQVESTSEIDGVREGLKNRK